DFGRKLLGDFEPNLIVFGADAGSDESFELAGLGAEVVGHAFDGESGDAGCGAAPTSVYGSDGAVLAVEQEQRQAVGGADADQLLGMVGDEAVAFGFILGCE